MKKVLFLILITFTLISCQKQVDYTPQIQELTNRVNALQNSLNTSIAALQKSRDSLATALNQTNTNLAITNTNVTGLSTRMDSVKTALFDINSKLTLLTLRIDSANTQIALLNTQMATSISNTASLTSQITIINNNITNFTNSINILNQQYNTLIIILIGIQSQLNVTSNSLSSGLVAWYPFTGNAIDSSGNGNNGTVIGARLSTDRFGKSNSAYSFNGSGNYIRVADNTLTLNGNFSISCWAKINDLIPSYYDEAIFSQWDERTGRKFVFGYRCENSTGQSGFSLYKFGSNSIQYNNYQINWKSNSLWNQVIATYELGVVSKIYINGKLEYTTTNVPPSLASPNSATTPFEIGHGYGQNRELWFNGLIDDIRIYNRVLTANEINYLSKN
jgi:hypothetical protein